MADKEIDIRIRTAADTAAVKQAETALEGLETQARQTDAALDGVAASAGTGAAAGARRGKGAAAAMKEIAEEAPKAAAGSRNLGATIGQAGFQIQDFAVQVGGGTNALTAFAQQGSQLLGLFGPGGAIAGALLAVGAVAFNAFQATKDGGEESADAAARLTEELEKAAKEAARLNDEFGRDSAEAFIGALEREADSYRKINREVEANIELMRARRRAQAEVESEQAALALLKIDRDPNLTDEQKILARGQVQEGIEARRMAERLAEIGERVAQAEANLTQARSAVPLAENARDKALRQIEEEQQEAKRLRPRVAAQDREESLRKRLDGLNETGSDPETGELLLGRSFFERRKAIEDALASAAEASVGVTSKDRARLSQLEGTDGKGGSIAELVKGLADLQKAVEDARNAANTAGSDRDRTAAVAAEEIQGVTSAFTVARERRSLATSGAAADAAARAEEKRREEVARAGEQAGGIADRAANAVGRGNEAAAADFERLGNAVEANPSADGVAALQQAINAFAAAVESREAANARRFREMAADLEKVKAKLRTGGDGR